MEKLLITICGRAGSKGFKNKNLKTFCGQPLVYYSLAAAQLFRESRPDVQVDLCLNTDSEALAKLVAERYPEVVFLPRSEELGGDRVPKMAVIQDSLSRMEEKAGGAYNYVMDLDITSPLRTAQDVKGISRVHCELTVVEGKLYLKDAGSSYGTYLGGGQRLAANQAVELKPGDRFSLASQQETFVVDVKGGV